MKKTIIILILFVLAPIVYGQKCTLKDLKVNGKVKKISQYLYASNEASNQIDTLYLINQTNQFFNEMGYLTLDSGVTFWGENFQKEVYSYDSLNRLVQIITYDKGFEDRKFRKSEVKEFRYDQKGNVIFESHQSDFGGTRIKKTFYNEENNIILCQNYYIDNDSNTKDKLTSYTIYEYDSMQKISKSYNADSTLSAIWMYEYEKSDKVTKMYVFYKTKDSLELFETHDFYEDSTIIKNTNWRKSTPNFSIIQENIKYFDSTRRLIKQEYYQNGEIESVTEYFYDELGNCIKSASHNIISMPDSAEFIYMIYKYEFY